MPIKVKQEDGSEIDAYTAEELAAQTEAKSKEASDAAVAAETERLKTEHEAELLEKDEALKEAQDKLQKAADKELNFKKLREKQEGKSEDEKKVADEVKAMKETLAEIQKAPFETAKADFLKNNIGADKELGEKHDFFFKKLSAGAKTMDEYRIALESAFTLATGGTRQPNTSGAMLRTSVDPGFGGDKGGVESQDSQNFGALLGLKPEDKKTYGAAIKTGTVPLFAQTPPKEKSV